MMGIKRKAPLEPDSTLDQLLANYSPSKPEFYHFGTQAEIAELMRKTGLRKYIPTPERDQRPGTIRKKPEMYITDDAKTKQLGVFAQSLIRKPWDEEIGLFEYTGEKGREHISEDNAYTFLLSQDNDDNNYSHVIDASSSGNASRFINHSSICPNVEARIEETPDGNCIGIYLLHDINPGDQLLMDYGPFFKFDGFICQIHPSNSWKEAEDIICENVELYRNMEGTFCEEILAKLGLSLPAYFIIPELVHQIIMGRSKEMLNDFLDGRKKNSVNLPCFAIRDKKILPMRQQKVITPLMIAILFNQIDFVEILLSRGAFIDYPLPDGRLPIFLVIGQPDCESKWRLLDMMIQSMKKSKVNLLVQDCGGFSLLHHAAFENDLQSANFLLNNIEGDFFNLIDENDEFDPLIFAIALGRANFVSYFIEYLLEKGKAIFSSEQDQARLCSALKKIPTNQYGNVLEQLITYSVLPINIAKNICLMLASQINYLYSIINQPAVIEAFDRQNVSSGCHWVSLYSSLFNRVAGYLNQNLISINDSERQASPVPGFA